MAQKPPSKFKTPERESATRKTQGRTNSDPRAAPQSQVERLFRDYCMNKATTDETHATSIGQVATMLQQANANFLQQTTATLLQMDASRRDVVLGERALLMQQFAQLAQKPSWEGTAEIEDEAEAAEQAMMVKRLAAIRDLTTEEEDGEYEAPPNLGRRRSSSTDDIQEIFSKLTGGTMSQETQMKLFHELQKKFATEAGAASGTDGDGAATSGVSSGVDPSGASSSIAAGSPGWVPNPQTCGGAGPSGVASRGGSAWAGASGGQGLGRTAPGGGSNPQAVHGGASGRKPTMEEMMQEMREKTRARALRVQANQQQQQQQQQQQLDMETQQLLQQHVPLMDKYKIDSTQNYKVTVDGHEMNLRAAPDGVVSLQRVGMLTFIRYLGALHRVILRTMLDEPEFSTLQISDQLKMIFPGKGAYLFVPGAGMIELHHPQDRQVTLKGKLYRFSESSDEFLRV